MFDIPSAPTRVHYLFQENTEALQNAALLLGGPRWLKRVQNLFETLWTENFLHGRVRREINALHRLLTLVHVNDPSRPEAAYFKAIDPMSPHLEEIAFLAYQLRQAFEEAFYDKGLDCEEEERNYE